MALYSNIRRLRSRYCNRKIHDRMVLDEKLGLRLLIENKTNRAPFSIAEPIRTLSGERALILGTNLGDLDDLKLNDLLEKKATDYCPRYAQNQARNDVWDKSTLKDCFILYGKGKIKNAPFLPDDFVYGRWEGFFYILDDEEPNNLVSLTCHFSDKIGASHRSAYPMLNWKLQLESFDIDSGDVTGYYEVPLVVGDDWGDLFYDRGTLVASNFSAGGVFDTLFLIDTKDKETYVPYSVTFQVLKERARMKRGECLYSLKVIRRMRLPEWVVPSFNCISIVRAMNKGINTLYIARYVEYLFKDIENEEKNDVSGEHKNEIITGLIDIILDDSISDSSSGSSSNYGLVLRSSEYGKLIEVYQIEHCENSFKVLK